jgi:hypothetical protein
MIYLTFLAFSKSSCLENCCLNCYNTCNLESMYYDMGIDNVLLFCITGGIVRRGI